MPCVTVKRTNQKPLPVGQGICPIYALNRGVMVRCIPRVRSLGRMRSPGEVARSVLKNSRPNISLTGIWIAAREQRLGRRVRFGPRGKNMERHRSIPKPNDEFAPSYETCLTSQVSEGNLLEIKALTSKNWVKRVVDGVIPQRQPVWTSIHNDWKRPSYVGLQWTEPPPRLSSRPKRSSHCPPAPIKPKYHKRIPLSRIPSFPPLLSTSLPLSKPSLHLHQKTKNPKKSKKPKNPKNIHLHPHPHSSPSPSLPRPYPIKPKLSLP